MRYRLGSMTPVGVRLREIRKSRGLSQDQLAAKAGVPQSTVSRIETGKTSAIEFSVLDKLSSALGCEPGELIVRTKKGR